MEWKQKSWRSALQGQIPTWGVGAYNLACQKPTECWQRLMCLQCLQHQTQPNLPSPNQHRTQSITHRKKSFKPLLAMSISTWGTERIVTDNHCVAVPKFPPNISMSATILAAKQSKPCASVVFIYYIMYMTRCRGYSSIKKRGSMDVDPYGIYF